MKQRCYNINSSDYALYGGNGITICDEWLNSPTTFIKWALQNGYNESLNIDRINNDLGYSPSNCRFVNDVVNAQNKRLLSSVNKSGYRGVFKCQNRYRAGITHNNVKYFLGYYDTKETAAKAYNEFVITNNTNHPLNII